MMARYFYAFRWAYGIGATWDDGSWPGELYVFESRAERDAWVADDVFDGNWHCEAITSKEARHIMADRPCFGAGFQCHVVHLAAAAQCAPECLFLFRRRVEAEPVCPLGCRGVHTSYDTLLYRLVCSYVRQRRLISP